MNIELKSFMSQMRELGKVFINKHKIALLCLRQPASMNYLRGTNLRLRSIKISSSYATFIGKTLKTNFDKEKKNA